MKHFISIIALVLFSLNVFSQAGQKWSVSGNNIYSGQYLGTNNYAPLVLKTNSTSRLTIDENGNIIFNGFANGQTGIAFLKDDGVLQKLPLTNSGSDVLCGDGQFRDIYSLSPQTGWKRNGMTIYAEPGYQIGIGTYTPSATLDVDGDAIVRGTLYVYNGIIVGTKYTGEKVDVDTVKSTNAETVEMKAEQYKTNTINIDGNNSTITSSTGLIDFDNTTIRANNMLTNNFHVYGTASMDSLIVGNQLQIGNNTLFLSSDYDLNGVVNHIYTESGDLYIQSQSNDFNTIINANNKGFVGIGTDAPQQNLHIRGVTQDDFNNPPMLSAVIRIEDVYISAAQPAPAPRSAYWDIAASAHREGLFFTTDNGCGDAQTVLTLMESTGFVGIGTTAPQHRLDVCGVIRATEIKVDLNGTCPDFVFDEDYKLLSFEELQAYIDEFGHLPGIPSAEETEENGINVSEMNMMLLQKVEELTLYILQLENRINELEQCK